MRGCVRRCVLAAAGAGGLALIGASGCGWTARDQFASDRQVVLRPQNGDGSRVSSGWDPRQVAQKASGSPRVAGARGDD